LAIDRASGEIVWQKVLHSAIPHEGAHRSASLANISPVADADHVYFYFGSYGLYCLTRDGRLVWTVSLGTMHSKHGHGEGSSPVLSGDRLVVNCDHEGDSFVVALDKQTGAELWRQPRDEETSWASPIIVEVDGRMQVIASATNRIRGYDLQSGKLIWQCGGLSQNVVSSPVYSDGMLYVGSSYEIRRIMGIRIAGAKGDITSTNHVVWTHSQKTPYVPSPLLVDGKLYYLRHYQGILTRLIAQSGAEPTGPFRLAQLNDVYASPVSAAGRIYVSDRHGTTVVMTTDDEPKQLALNRLDDTFSASAAIAGDELYLRGERKLYCIAGE
jgi:outer membrane protein assembly factor BamB